MVQAPIFHVNGGDREACVRVARLAFAYRQRFGRDVVIDLVCYRRLGHNEGDDPTYTQPKMYKAIEKLPSTAKLYANRLVKEKVLTADDVTAMRQRLNAQFSAAHDTAKQATPPPDVAEVEPVSGSTAVERATLERVVNAITSFPETFTVHPKL